MNQLTIYRQYFTNTDCYKAGVIQKPIGIQVHSTGANNPYLKRYVQPNDGRLGVNSNKNDHNHRHGDHGRTDERRIIKAVIQKKMDGRDEKRGDKAQDIRVGVPFCRRGASLSGVLHADPSFSRRQRIILPPAGV